MRLLFFLLLSLSAIAISLGVVVGRGDSAGVVADRERATELYNADFAGGSSTIRLGREEGRNPAEGLSTSNRDYDSDFASWMAEWDNEQAHNPDSGNDSEEFADVDDWDWDFMESDDLGSTSTVSPTTQLQTTTASANSHPETTAMVATTSPPENNSTPSFGDASSSNEEEDPNPPAQASQQTTSPPGTEIGYTSAETDSSDIGNPDTVSPTTQLQTTAASTNSQPETTAMVATTSQQAAEEGQNTLKRYEISIASYSSTAASNEQENLYPPAQTSQQTTSPPETEIGYTSKAEESNAKLIEGSDLDETNAGNSSKHDPLDQVYEGLGLTTTNITGPLNSNVTLSTEINLYARFCTQLWRHLKVADEAELLQLFKEGQSACCSINGKIVFKSNDNSTCTTSPLMIMASDAIESHAVAGNIALARNGGNASAFGSGNVAIAYDEGVASTGDGCEWCQKNMAVAGGKGSYAKCADQGRALSFNFALAEKGGRALSSSGCIENCKNNNATAIGGHALTASFAKGSQRNTAIAVGFWNETVPSSRTLADVATSCTECNDNMVDASGSATAIAARLGAGKSHVKITSMMGGSIANYPDAKNCEAIVLRQRVTSSNC